MQLTISTIRLRHHHYANIDLYLTQHSIMKCITISYNWTRGHSDKEPWETIEDFKSQKLS